MSHRLRVVDTTDDARIARTRAAAREAMRSLFAEEGPAALTHQRVAQRAGVGRATIYRHWPQQIDLVIETLAVVEQPMFRTREGPLRAWLSGELIRFTADLAQPVALQFLATVVGTADHLPAVAKLRDDVSGRILTVLRSEFERAEAEGETVGAEEETATRRDYDELLAQLLGPLIFMVAVQRAAVDRDFIDRVVDTALRSTSWRSSGRAP